jgi:acetate kinase
MPVLVVNCGSTSLKGVIVDPTTGRRLAELKAERLGSDDATVRINRGPSQSSAPTHAAAIAASLPRLLERLPDGAVIESVGHRIVHGGLRFTAPTVIDDPTLVAIERLSPLAPLHTPANVAGIRAARELLPDVPHIAVFDTAFHRTMPARAETYALPQDLAGRNNLIRFGFHGTSHHFVARRAAEFLGRDLRELRLITCHLGGGCSLCAVENGRSVETSMGMTPLEGLVMGTRSGDLDPGAIIQLMRSEGMDADELDLLLNHRSGLSGLSGIGSDMRDIEREAEAGNEDCRLALQVFCHRIRKCIGAYAAVMGGVDAIVFTAGIGQNSAVVRHRVAQRLDFLGASLDESRNRVAKVDSENPVASIATVESRVSILVVATDEAWEIARQCEAIVRAGGTDGVASPDDSSGLGAAEDVTPAFDSPSEIDHTIPVAISARHVHLTQETVELLFGAGHQLRPLKSLSQPGQFAAQEEVTLVGPKRSIESVRVLGPTRQKDQVEISRTDEFYLGIDAPIRASGDVENSPGITLIGTDGRSVTLQQGVICAWRHIHMTPEDAAFFGVADRDVVEVEVGMAGLRSLTFGDVLIRVKPSYRLEMHIDTDEGNAAELNRHDVGELELTDAQAILRLGNRLE